jgi:hypothetical protein
MHRRTLAVMCLALPLYAHAALAQTPIPADGGDSRRAQGGDWHPNFFKAECGVGEAIVGFATTPSTGKTKALLCSAPNPDVYRRDACRLQPLGDIYLPGGGDWKPHHFKMHCGNDEYFAGLSQTQQHQNAAVLCCKGRIATTRCTAWTPPAMIENAGIGDWSPGSTRLECGPGRWLAGFARDPNSGSLSAGMCCDTQGEYAIKGSAATIYYLSGGTKFPIANMPTLYHLVGPTGQFVPTSNETLGVIPTGGMIDLATLPKGIKGPASAVVYYYKDGKKFAIPDMETLTSLGGQVSTVPDAWLERLPQGLMLPSVVAGRTATKTVTLYADGAYSGTHFRPTLLDNPSLPAALDDKASSITLQTELPVALYDEPNFGGACLTVRGDRIGLGAFDNRVSSLRIGWSCEDGEANGVDACVDYSCGPMATCTDLKRDAPNTGDGRTCTMRPDAPTNLAAGAAVRLSSQYQTGAGARAVDGKTDTDWGRGCCAHTLNEVGWLEVDLGAPKRIGPIVVFNGPIEVNGRLTGARVELSTDKCDAPTRQVIAQGEPYDASKIQTRTLLVNGTPPEARYVCLRQSRSDFLHIAEIQVFADPDACSTSPCPGNQSCSDKPGVDTSAAGRTCGCPAGYGLAADGCVDIDECASNNGGCAQTCTNSPGTFTCTNDSTVRYPGQGRYPTKAVVGGATRWTFSMTNTFHGVSLVGAQVDLPRALVLLDAASGTELARGPLVSEASSAIELPISATVIRMRPYLLVLRRAGVPDKPLDAVGGSARFRLIPDELQLVPHLDAGPVWETSSSTSASFLNDFHPTLVEPSGAGALGFKVGRPIVVTGLRLTSMWASFWPPTQLPPNGGEPTALTAHLWDVASNAHRSALIGNTMQDGMPWMVAPIAAGQSYRLGVTSAGKELRVHAVPLTPTQAARGCTDVGAHSSESLITLEGAYRNAPSGAPSHCLWSQSTRIGYPGSLASAGVSPVMSLYVGGIALRPQSTRSTQVRNALGTRAYVVSVTEPVVVGALVWGLASMPADKTIFARIWDDTTGEVLASGLPVAVQQGGGELASPFTPYTLVPSRTYRIGFVDPSLAVTFEQGETATSATQGLPLAFPEWTAGALSVKSAISNTGAGDAAPSVPNSWHPSFVLWLLPAP